MAYNLFAGNSVLPQWPNPAVYVADASCVGSVFWRNVLPMDLVVDHGTRSVWADNTDAMKLHLKDAMDFELPRRK
jgi:hypothetical protein